MTEAPGPDIALHGVTKRFGAHVAVDDVTLAVERSSFFALLGPSGCGKTTTLRMIGGFEDPTAGRVELGGVDVTDVPPYRRDVNTVFQSYALFPHLTVEQNVGFGLQRKKVPKSEARVRVAEILELVQLEGLGRRRPAQLSGGQQQRVALARALVNDPRALLLDEPLGAALLGLFLTTNVARGFLTILIAHVMFTLGFVVVTIRARLEGMDLHIEEAAMDLGANEWTTLRKVTLPLIAPGVAAAGLLAYAISLDDFVVTNFNAGQTVTFPLFIYGAARQGVPPQVNVLATALLLVVLGLMVLNVVLQRRLAQRDAPGLRAAPAPA